MILFECIHAFFFGGRNGLAVPEIRGKGKQEKGELCKNLLGVRLQGVEIVVKLQGGFGGNASRRSSGRQGEMAAAGVLCPRRNEGSGKVRAQDGRLVLLGCFEDSLPWEGREHRRRVGGGKKKARLNEKGKLAGEGEHCRKGNIYGGSDQKGAAVAIGK